MYSSIDPQTDALALSFCTEAEKLWNVERDNKRDSVLNIAATEFLCLGYLGQGRDHAILKYVTEASEMGVRMGLFGVPDQNDGAGEEVGKPVQVTDQETKGRMHAAWGVFNWITLSRPKPRTSHGRNTKLTCSGKDSCPCSIVSQA